MSSMDDAAIKWEQFKEIANLEGKNEDLAESCRLSFLAGYFYGVADVKEMMLDRMMNRETNQKYKQE